MVSPDNDVGADDELGLRVPLVVRDVVARLQPDPLVTLRHEAVVTRLSLARLHHCERFAVNVATHLHFTKGTPDHLHCS